LNDSLYQIEIGEMTLDTKFYTAELKEITETQDPEPNTTEKTEEEGQSKTEEEESDVEENDNSEEEMQKHEQEQHDNGKSCLKAQQDPNEKYICPQSEKHRQDLNKLEA
ncbi:45285_t:CDS:2, partial [Gigaspora margarita]